MLILNFEKLRAVTLLRLGFFDMFRLGGGGGGGADVSSLLVDLSQ